jgi:hypothetical protein
VLGRKLAALADVMSSLFFSYTRKTHGRLTTSAVLFGQLHKQSLQYFFGVSL